MRWQKRKGKSNVIVVKCPPAPKMQIESDAVRRRCTVYSIFKCILSKTK